MLPEPRMNLRSSPSTTRRKMPPVSFPPIWSVSWFRWAQYDASVQNELVRNAGEALGVKALINLTAKEGHHRRSAEKAAAIQILRPLAEYYLDGEISSQDPIHLNRLAGQDDPEFKGLHAPRWQDAAKHFAAVSDWQVDENSDKVKDGRKLYGDHCVECHHEPVRDKAWTGKSFWRRCDTAEPNPVSGARKETVTTTTIYANPDWLK